MKVQKSTRTAQRKRQHRLTSLGLLGAGGLLLILATAWVIKTNQPTPKATVVVNGSPSLKVDKENVDLGEVKLGNTVEVAFTLTNVGNRPLELSQAPYIEVVEGC